MIIKEYLRYMGRRSVVTDHLFSVRLQGTPKKIRKRKNEKCVPVQVVYCVNHGGTALFEYNLEWNTVCAW